MDLATIQSGGGGLAGSIARAGLTALSWPYGLVARWRIAAYDRRSGPQRVGVAVACVGNLTAGGTGKTPFVAWLARAALERGRHPAVLSRGYGARPPGESLSDEGVLLRDLLGPSVVLAEDADRVRGARATLAAHPDVDLLLLDDGFQHRRLARDLDVVLLDATNPFGGGRLLPRGTLREPVEGLARAHAVVVTRAERVTADELTAIEDRVARLAPGAMRASVRLRPRALVRARDGADLSLTSLRGEPVLAWAGIGNPAAFAATLTDAGARVVARRFDRDHRAIGAEDVAAATRAARAAGARFVVVTRKDLVKLRGFPGLGDDVVALDVELEPGPGALEVRERVLACRAADPVRTLPGPRRP